ncbi:hypothetical protein P7C71_g5761, partial [Lecanoromycetidae sp. Uapishka_2]
MEYLTAALLGPRRLTRMYADTKRSYEQIVQAPITNPQVSSLHLKLKIQKDRYVAWGLEWADSTADQTDDIDQSLDRAGISDLVASIMTSIGELIDEAERIQPQSRSPVPGSYPGEKTASLAGPSFQWTPSNLARLEDIAKDMTTSIDTLCDLSKSQQLLKQQPSFQEEKKLLSQSISFQSEKAAQDHSPPKPSHITSDEGSASQTEPNFISSTRINVEDLMFPTPPQSPGSLPPSYDSTATDPGNRVFAFLKFSRDIMKGSTGQPYDMPVLVDYHSDDGASASRGPRPSLQRYENLVLALQGFPQDSEISYTGSLRILGWLADPERSRFAFVYGIPCSPHNDPSHSLRTAQPPHSLLSFLQHSGDTDQSNVPSLEDRFRLALNLATNLLHVHAKGLTHRNINSNNIVFVNDSGPQDSDGKPWTEGVIRRPHLVSWDQAANDTSTSQQEILISKIYRHPSMTRAQRSAYKPVHDVYGLGLVLLEVGLWMPLNKLWKTKYGRLDFKARLQSIYTKKLIAKCGKGYTSAVEYCLSAVERAQSTPASIRTSLHEQQTAAKTDFYWKVFKPLERCSMIDASDEPRIMTTPSALLQRSELAQTRISSPSEAEPGVKAQNESTSVITSAEDIANARLWDAVKADSPLEPGVKIDVCIWSHKIPQATRTYFDTVMMPRVSRMFAKAINRWESYEIQVCMAGKTPETAKPTVLMVCRSIRRAWKILSHVNEEKGLFDIQVASGQLTRSKRAKKKRTKTTKNCQTLSNQPSRFQQNPTCGASIGCFVDEQHSDAVTFGGVILVNGEPHGMSVHHMLEDPDAAVGKDDRNGSWPPNIASVPGLEDDVTANFDLLDISDDEFDGLETSVPDFDWDNDLNAGDVMGTKPGEGVDIIVTQPALDDVEVDFFPSEDDMSDDHLVIHGLGNIHASSGLRRCTYGEIAHEVDWALFKLHEDRKSSTNVVRGGSQHCQISSDGGSYPSRVVRTDALGELQVHAFGSTSGLAGGIMLPEMQMTKMPGRLYPSPVWRVKGNFGVGGDSGAWVIDNATGGVCGHVTAYSESWQYATIAPMEVMLHDMEQELGARIALPVTGCGLATESFKQQIVEKAASSSATNPAELEGVASDTLVTDLPPNPRLKDRSMSVDSTQLGSDDEHDSEKGNNPHSSPPLATSPQPSMKTMSDLNLDSVTKKWTCAQESKRNSMDGESKKGKGVGQVAPMREGLQAKC